MERPQRYVQLGVLTPSRPIVRIKRDGRTDAIVAVVEIGPCKARLSGGKTLPDAAAAERLAYEFLTALNPQLEPKDWTVVNELYRT